MTNPFRHVRDGEPLAIPAAAWNGMADAARHYADHQLGSRAGSTREPLSPGQILIQNDSGEDRDQHDVLGISGIAITPTQNEKNFIEQPVLTGVIPGAEFEHFGRFVVLAEPIRSGAVGRAWISGVFIARIAGEGSYCDVEGQPDHLRAAPFGHARILYAEDGDEERWAVIQMACPQLQCVAKANGLIEAGDAGTFTVLSEGDEEETEIIITAGNPSGPTVEPDLRYELKWINQAWEVGDGPCGDA